MARVVLALAWVLPRYWLLLARDHTGRFAASQAAWDRTHAVAAREFRRVALSLAGAFTKAAQIGGARADILPAAFIDELSQFHDAVPPRPFESLVGIVERDLGRPLDAVFASVERDALAAASLAQVHRATLRDGSAVVLKIQYPEIRRIIPLDLGMLRRVAGIVHRIQNLLDVRSLVNEVTRFIELELDFEREVRSTERLAATLAGRSDVRVPRVHRALCGPNLIVLEYLDGIQVTRTADLVAAGHKLADVARSIGAIYGSMIFEYDFFHGDPHPGNLLVLPDGRIGLLDFGLCKDLPDGFARLVAQMMVSAMIGDAASAMAAASSLGFDTERIRPEHLRSLMLMTLGDSDTDAGVLEILSESRIRRIPEDFALVVRTLILLNGLSHRLVPGRRLIQAELLAHLAVGASRDAGASRVATSSQRGAERAVPANAAASAR
jgi:ubiquinone biosynthesis protein